MKFGKNDAILITNPLNVFYLTNFTGSNAQVVITKKGKKYFLTDSRYKEQANNELNSKYAIKIYKKFEKTLKEIIRKENIRKLGFEDKHLTYYQYITYSQNLDIELLPVGNCVEKLRLHKKKREIDKITKAVDIAEKSLENVIGCMFKPLTKEIEFKILIENEMIKNGASASSFPTIVASGKRSSLVHGTASHEILHVDDTVVIDFGAKYKGYCSDKTVTFVNKKSCKEVKDVYNIVKDAKNFAIDKIKPGVKANKIDKIARDYIAKKGFGKYFQHALGHGVGVDVHEAPTISPLSDDIIEERMVFTVEPGIYIPDKFGIRLEDMVFVNNENAELLTTPAENFIFEDLI